MIVASAMATPQISFSQLLKGADAGDAQSCFEAGFRFLQGTGAARSLRNARAYFGRAASLGHRDAAAIFRALVGSGIGGPRDWGAAVDLLAAAAEGGDEDAMRQLDLLREMLLTGEGDPVRMALGVRVGNSPEATMFPKLVSQAECQFLVECARPAFRPALVGHASDTRGHLQQQQVRTCETAGFPWVAENPVIHAINRRLATASGTQPEAGEPLQILRYFPGQEFKPHRDCTSDVANQRIFTVLVYLNDGYTGGETLFCKSGLKVRGEPGDALVFRNADEEGRPDPDSLHAGLSVTSGVKLIASRWIRRKRFGPVE
jgi:prolyl 4-hydroxylase